MFQHCKVEWLEKMPNFRKFHEGQKLLQIPESFHFLGNWESLDTYWKIWQSFRFALDKSFLSRLKTSKYFPAVEIWIIAMFAHESLFFISLGKRQLENDSKVWSK